MSIADKLTRLSNAKDDIIAALDEKGIDATGHGFGDFAQDIGNISGGSSGGGGGVTVEPLSVSENGTYTAPTGKAYSPVTVNVQPPAPVGPSDVNFIDYDGTIVYAYTAADFTALTEMPSNPTHEGLTSQGWNWTLADAKAYVAAHGRLRIGQCYVTDDGKTRLYITISEGRQDPYLGLRLTSGKKATVDFGDGSPLESVTGLGFGMNSVVWTPHHYTSGDFVITIAPEADCEIEIRGYNGKNDFLSYGGNRYDNRSYAYRAAIKKVELGSNIHSIEECAFGDSRNLMAVTIPAETTFEGRDWFINCFALKSIMLPDSVTSIARDAFNNCSALTSIMLPDGVTSIGASVFNGCSALTSITLPDGVTSIGTNAFNGCSALTSITLPDDVTSIGNDAFKTCRGLAFIRFLSETPPVVDGSGAFSDIPTDCTIYVPAGTKAAYEAATNYPDPATYTYAEDV